MLQPTELLRTYALVIQHLTGARGVSIYLPTPRPTETGAVLVHSQEQPQVKELSTLEAALRLQDLPAAPRGTSTPDGSEDESRILQIRGSDPNTWLLALPFPDPLLSFLRGHERSPGPSLRRRAGDPAEGALDRRPKAWLGLSLPEGRSLPWARELAAPPGVDDWQAWLLGLGGALGWHAQELSIVLQDPVSQLPARAGFQVQLEHALEEARATSSPLILVLINPEDLELVAERFGREIGNQVVRELSQRLTSSLRRTDLLGRFSSSVFAAALPATPLQESAKIFDALRRNLTETPYRHSSVRLGVSLGVSAFDPHSEESALALLRRTDRALTSAKEAGGDRTIVARAEEGTTGAPLDRLSGIFTANLAKDYRNMLLLWDTVTIVSANPGFDTLAAQVVDRLFATFKPLRTGLFSASQDGYHLVYGRQASSTLPPTEENPFPLDELSKALLEEAQKLGRMARTPPIAEDDENDEKPRQLYALPLLARQQCLGWILLEGGEDSMTVDASDEIFLRALSSHLAVAFDRTLLAEQERNRQERERLNLRAEIQELRQAVQGAKLVYRSPRMEELLSTVRRVAPTHATVLITGESGTGKELVARTLHEISGRRHKPLVVVDCTAISDSLIDSELFGHEKGAFTGAQTRGTGRLAEADGGTIVLDEIGEMPLQVQSKLLRFVQERQLTPVGSSRSRSIDVRVIASTHRDLAAAASAGTFREDLYYRLNVVRLVVPPLRQRPEDILFLAHHFLQRFAIEYQKGVHRLDGEAEAAMLRHPWPGNVRELENRIRQAVILGQGNLINARDLGLELVAVSPAALDPPTAPLAPPTPRAGVGLPAPDGPPLPPSPPPAIEPATVPFSTEAVPPTEAREDLGDPFEDLEVELERQVRAALESPFTDVWPLGRWLGEDLVLEADEMSVGVQSRGARLLGIAETTFRRRLAKAQALGRQASPPRSPGWSAVRSSLRRILQVYGDSDEDLPLKTRQRLMRQVARQVPDHRRRGADLMGVSEPTFRRWLEKLSAESSDP